MFASRRSPIKLASFWIVLLACSFALSWPSVSWAGGGPENLVLVVNADSASSKLIANHYIAGRQIPARNVIYLSDIPDAERIHLDVFREKILKPLLTKISERKIGGSIDYIVYSADFPTIITIEAHKKSLEEQVEKQTGRSDLQSKLFAAHASINALTYYSGAVLTDQPGYMMLDSNTYYRLPAVQLLTRPFAGPRQQEFQDATHAFNLEEGDKYEAAIKTLESIAAKNPQQAAVMYWLARFYGQKGDAKNAVRFLTFAIRAGWDYRTHTKSDLAFDPVRSDVLFKGIVDRIPDLPFDFAPTHGFKHQYNWGVNGMLNREPEQGNQYFLSTVLAVTRNEGTTEEEALFSLKRSMDADGSHPNGTFYFSDTSDVRNQTRKPNYANSILALRKMGHDTEIIKTAIPRLRDDVLGLTTGTAKFNWTKSGSKIVPGAIGDNLTSYGGRMNNPSQTKLSEFIRNGAAGGSGAVVEPYAIQAKFPHPMIHTHYARGCSLAEAFYQSVHGPFQLLIVGDALCQPYVNRPELRIRGLDPRKPVKGKVELKLDLSKSKIPVAHTELYVDGVMVHRDQLGEKLGFDSTSMSDGYHELRFVSVAKNAIESVANIIVPITVDNQGHNTELTTLRKEYSETATIKFQAKSNYGDSIELVHNMRSIAKKIGNTAEFEIPATLFGRGPIKVEAIALSSESEQGVSSQPLKLTIQGRVMTTKGPREPPKRKRPLEPAKN